MATKTKNKNELMEEIEQKNEEIKTLNSPKPNTSNIYFGRREK